jgi:hypothetical protein
MTNHDDLEGALRLISDAYAMLERIGCEDLLVSVAIGRYLERHGVVATEELLSELGARSNLKDEEQVYLLRRFLAGKENKAQFVRRMISEGRGTDPGNMHKCIDRWEEKFLGKDYVVEDGEAYGDNGGISWDKNTKEKS